MITTNLANLLDKAGSGLGKVFAKYKIGSKLKDMQDDIDSLDTDISTLEKDALVGKVITYKLESEDISDSAFTITLDYDFTAMTVPLVIAENGTVRAVTKIEQDTSEEEENEITITATSCAADDTVSFTVYL